MGLFVGAETAAAASITRHKNTVAAATEQLGNSQNSQSNIVIHSNHLVFRCNNINILQQKSRLSQREK